VNFAVQELRAAHQAVTFFTRIPLPPLRDWKVDDLQRSVAYFPLIGWLVGAVAAFTWYAASQLWSPAIASGISLASTLLLTGAFHEDGFADVCDGFGGGYSAERVLEIMRDSRVGAFGAIGVVVLLGLKWNAVAALSAPLGLGILVAAHAASRGCAVSLMMTLPYVQSESGKAKPLATRLSAPRFAVAMLFALLPTIALLPVRLWAALVVLFVIRFVLARWFVRRIGGYTGDCLGAAQQIAEVVFYLTVLALAR
jgi:adenosylcobinamide-GDP ribazoletransferase